MTDIAKSPSRKTNAKIIGFLICVGIATGISNGLHAQGSTYLPNVIPPSPNAAALMKFTDVPVNNYNGTADITVPIYTIQARGISVPVTLAYHTGGIKLKEESGWAGLGWALNAGGMISRTIMGEDDFGDYFSNLYIEQKEGDVGPHTLAVDLTGGLSPYLYDFICNNLINLTTGTENVMAAYQGGNVLEDMEPDIYSYNFSGHSGKFIILKNRQVVLNKQENIKIMPVFTNPPYVNTIDTFRVIDEQGNIFVFYDKDYTQSSAGGGQPASSWNLSKILTQQKDSINFTYVADGSWINLAPDIITGWSGFCQASTASQTNSPYNSYSSIMLQKIDFANGQLQFSFDNGRLDLINGKKLDAVTVYSKTPSGALSYVKEEDLSYSYFAQGQPYGAATEYERLRLDSIKEISGSASVPPYKFSYNGGDNNSTGKHSYAVDHWGYYNNATGNVVFTPSESILFNSPTVPSTLFTYAGANREPDSAHMSLFALNQITYPTGGKTVLRLEANDYDQHNSITGPQEYPQAVLVNRDTILHFPASGSAAIDMSKMLYTGTESVTITFRGNTNDANDSNNTATGHIYCSFSGPAGSPTTTVTEDIAYSGVTCGANSPVCTVSPYVNELTTGIYTVNATVNPLHPGDFNEIQVEIRWQETQTQYNLENNIFVVTGGGLRVKSITDYASDSVIAKVRQYSYGYTVNAGGPVQVHSYGRLMSYPSYVRQEIVPIDPTGEIVGHCYQLDISGTSNTALTSVATGNIVGYDEVTETTINPANGNDNGKTVCTYHNSADTGLTYNGFRFPGLLNIGDNLNGSLLSKTVYADNGGGQYQKLSVENNYYSNRNRNIYYSAKGYLLPPTIGKPGGGPDPDCPGDTCSEDNEFTAFLYPGIKSERILLDSSMQTVFAQNDTTQYLTTTTRNYYDNPAHYLVTRTNVTDSKGNTHVSYIKYPQDYIPPGNTLTGNTILDTMINKNIWGAPIEKTDSLYYSGSSAGYVTGAVLGLFRVVPPNNVVLPDRTYKLMLASPANNFQPMAVSGNTVTQDGRYAQMASMDSYDSSYNIAQYTRTDLVPVSIIWDYKREYPVAQAVNAPLAKTAYTSFEADGSGNWAIGSTARDTTKGVTGENSYSLANGSISKSSGIVAGDTLIVSYWSTGSSYTVSGTIGSVITGKTESIRGTNWTYYEHAVTGVTAVTVSGSGNIDELRLYPKYAQMTTYTFTPLVGMASQCDVNNRVSYYEYDGLQRLKDIKDQDGNILKTYDYHYKH